MARLNRNETGANARVGAIPVTTTAKPVAELRNNRVSLSLRNAGTTDVFLGKDALVTISTGYPLHADEEYEYIDYVGAVYVVSGSAGDLRYWEIF